MSRTVPAWDAAVLAPQAAQKTSTRTIDRRAITTRRTSAHCFTIVSQSYRCPSSPHLPHRPGRRYSAGMLVSIFRVAPGCPALRPGGLHTACLAFLLAAAALLRRSDVHEFVDDGEWGPLWHLSLLARSSFLPSSSPILFLRRSARADIPAASASCSAFSRATSSACSAFSRATSSACSAFSRATSSACPAARSAFAASSAAIFLSFA